MPNTIYKNQLIQNFEYQGVAESPPADWYYALFSVPQFWSTSLVVTLNELIIPTSANWPSSGSVGHFFKATTAGTTSSTTEPAWSSVAAGGTITDGTVVWTEQSLVMAAGGITGFEVSGNGYAREAVVRNSTNYGASNSAFPTIVNNLTAVSFPTPTGTGWGYVCGWGQYDASTAGNLCRWSPLTTYIGVGGGTTPTFAIDSISLELA